jgi:hypothetical protein
MSGKRARMRASKPGRWLIARSLSSHYTSAWIEV